MNKLDPVYWLGEDGYNQVATFLVESVFNGVLARCLSAMLLIIGVWFVFRRKQTAAGIGFIALSVTLVFGKMLFGLATAGW